MRLNNMRDRFEHRVLEAETFVSRCGAALHHRGYGAALLARQLEWAHELAMLKVIVASEEFFETTMGLYVIGERTSRGYRPRRRRQVRSSLPEVLKVFRGDRDYVGWGHPADVIQRAEQWLRNGDPYQTTLSAASQLLVYLKTMRNCIAHESDSAFDKYKNATRKLYGALPRNVSPGAQLILPPPAAIPGLVGASLFDASLGVYRLVAQQIVR